MSALISSGLQIQEYTLALTAYAMTSKGILCRCYYAVYDIMSFQHSQITESDQQKEGDVKERGRIHLCA